MKAYLFFSLLICSFIALARAELPDNVSILISRTPNSDDSDLRVFDDIAKKAQILALGESAHGSAGYSQMQHRLIRYLVTRHGYRKLLMEVASDDRAINHYLKSGVGDLKDILYLNAWHEANLERLELYKWIRSFNEQNPLDQVFVEAVDPQKPWQNTPELRKFLSSVSAGPFEEDIVLVEENCLGAGKANQIDWAFSPEGQDYARTGTIQPERHSKCLAALTEIEKLFRSESPTWIRRVGGDAVGDAWNDLRSLKAWQLKSFLLSTDTKKALGIREEVFGPSALWKALKFEVRPKKSILIAHNLHISKVPLLVEPNDPWSGLQTVGAHLHKHLGERYQAIAQTGYQVRAMFAKPYPLPDSPLSLDVFLKSLDKDFLYVNLSKASWIRERTEWLMHLESRPNGRAYPLPKAFDGAIFHALSEESKFLGKP